MNRLRVCVIQRIWNTFLCFMHSPNNEPRFGNLDTCFGRSCNYMYRTHVKRLENYDPQNKKKHIYPGLDDCDVKNENGEYMKLGHSQFRIALLWSCHCYWKYPFWIVSVHIPLFHYYLNYKCSSGCSGGKGAFLISISNCIDIKSVCKSIDFHEHSQCVDVLFCRYNYL